MSDRAAKKEWATPTLERIGSFGSIMHGGGFSSADGQNTTMIDPPKGT